MTKSLKVNSWRNYAFTATPVRTTRHGKVHVLRPQIDGGPRHFDQQMGCILTPSEVREMRHQ